MDSSLKEQRGDLERQQGPSQREPLGPGTVFKPVPEGLNAQECSSVFPKRCARDPSCPCPQTAPCFYTCPPNHTQCPPVTSRVALGKLLLAQCHFHTYKTRMQRLLFLVTEELKEVCMPRLRCVWFRHPCPQHGDFPPIVLVVICCVPRHVSFLLQFAISQFSSVSDLTLR